MAAHNYRSLLVRGAAGIDWGHVLSATAGRITKLVIDSGVFGALRARVCGLFVSTLDSRVAQFPVYESRATGTLWGVLSVHKEPTDGTITARSGVTRSQRGCLLRRPYQAVFLVFLSGHVLT